MISKTQFETELQLIIQNGIREDVGQGDHSSLACIPSSATGKAKLLVKEDGIIAGVAFAKMILEHVDPALQMETFIVDGTPVKKGDVVCIIEAMKLMNEIAAEEEGQIVEVCVQNGQIVEYGQTLFKLS